MMSVVPVAVNHPHSLTYRGVEVEQIQRRNMMFALAISIAIHALIIASYHLFPSPAIDMSKVKFKPPGETPWTKSRIDLENIDITTIFSGAAPKVGDVKAGRIVAVPAVVAEPNVPFATQDDLKKGIVLGGDNVGLGPGEGGNAGIAGGTPSGPVEVDEAEPPIFRAVEQPPMLVRRVAPKYPELMLKAEIEGKVTVSIWVDKQGKPHEVRILKGDNELFNEAAMEAAKQFLFTPAYMNNGPVSVWVSVPFSFRLSKF